MSCTDENYVENCVTCLTDSPDVHVVSLPHLRPQLKVNAVHLVGRSLQSYCLFIMWRFYYIMSCFLTTMCLLSFICRLVKCLPTPCYF